MIPIQGYAAKSSKSKLVPFNFKRRELRSHDVLIEILYCGICHSDIHQARNEWDNATYPMVPGHEITGRIARLGPKAKRFKVDDRVGVGCFVDSCRVCPNCKAGCQQFCDKHVAFTYNGTEMDEKTPTHGGYSSQIVVDESYVLKIPDPLPLAAAAPLLCAGITTYSPLRHFQVGKGQRVGIAGLGGLGHMGVKLAASFGAHVTVFSTSPEKEEDARRFGAKAFVISKKVKAMEALQNKFDLVLDTIAAPHDLNLYLALLKRHGKLVVVGVPEKKPVIEPFTLLTNNRQIAGSLIGGIPETQEMLNYCAKRGIVSDIERIPMDKVNEAYERTLRGDVKYRFVLDLKTI